MRGIQREKVFEADAAEIIGSVKRADEFLEATEDALARNPLIGTRLGLSDVWFLPVVASATVDPVVLYYTFNDQYVYFLSLQRTQLPEL